LRESEEIIAKLGEEQKRLKELLEERKLTLNKSKEYWSIGDEQLRQDMIVLEADRNYKEKELKLSEERRERAERELIVIKGKFGSLEKIVLSKVEEIKNLKTKIADSNEVKSNEVIVKLNNNIEELSKKLLKYNGLKKKHAMQKKRILELESLAIGAKEVEAMKNKLEEHNKALQIADDAKNSAIDAFQSLKNQHEILLKENANLKAAVFTYETSNSSSKTKATSGNEEQKVQIVEEMREVLAEVIYAYKTMETNAKQYIMNIQEKQYKIQELTSKKDKVLQANKKEEALGLLKVLEQSLPFLKGIVDKLTNLKLISNCLKEVIKKKADKFSLYNEEIGKFKAFIEVAESKIQEYEKRLAQYY